MKKSKIKLGKKHNTHWLQENTKIKATKRKAKKQENNVLDELVRLKEKGRKKKMKRQLHLIGGGEK